VGAGKSEADGQSQSRRHQLLEAIERKQQHFEGSVAQLQEERKTHVVEKKASEVGQMTTLPLCHVMTHASAGSRWVPHRNSTSILR
jgi:uncharacterized damage-inducible protein DinB